MNNFNYSNLNLNHILNPETPSSKHSQEKSSKQDTDKVSQVITQVDSKKRSLQLPSEKLPPAKKLSSVPEKETKQAEKLNQNTRQKKELSPELLQEMRDVFNGKSKAYYRGPDGQYYPC